VIHVSQLKKALGAGITVDTELPEIMNTNCIPEQVLGTRWRQKNSISLCQVLVKWSKLPDALAT
jgi:hypothetical protein